LFDVSTAKGYQLASIDGYIMSPDGKRLLIQTKTERIYRHSFTATYYIYTLQNNRLVPLSDNGPQQTPVFSPDGQQIAFVRDNNIFLVKLLYDNAEVQVTKDGQRNEVINGIPDWVNEEEFGHDRAMVFTADSRQLVWVRYDESAVRQYSMPLFKGLKPERSEYADYPGFYTYKYPIAGEVNSRVSVWSFDIGSRQMRQLQVPVDADGYIPRLRMTSDASQVAVFTLNRHQDCLRIFMCNPLSTVCRQVVEEKVSKYVREEAIDGIVLTDRHILLPSDRSGWMHLYLYNMNGQLLRQVDDGEYEVSEVYGYDEATGNTYFAAHVAGAATQSTSALGATEQRVYVVHGDGKKSCLTEKAGWNSAVFSSDYRYFIHTWSDINTPPVYALCNASGKMLTTLVDNQELRTKLSALNLGRRELFQLTTSDGVTLNGWMVKPADFDASKRYPVIMYQYGGPGSQQVKNAWSIGMSGQGAILEQLLSQQGYVCVCVDNRGTGGRGAEFEKCTYLKLGQLESRDQVESALWLGRQSWVDASRIAIWGWSFGGFNTLMAMSEGRGVFRCGIAIAPPTSWRYYDTVYTERFMRTPKENASGYDDCPISRAGKLSGDLLLCHGMADDNVHFRNTAEYTEALVQQDKDFEQLVYTNRNHSIYGGETRGHLFRQCLRFFDRSLR
jgi:dipeptidyl-peptidase-4